MGNYSCKNIQAVRLKRGLSQADLAEKINLSAGYYGKIERGETRLTQKNFTKICTVLNIAPEILNGPRLHVLFSQID